MKADWPFVAVAFNAWGGDAGKTTVGTLIIKELMYRGVAAEDMQEINYLHYRWYGFAGVPQGVGELEGGVVLFSTQVYKGRNELRGPYDAELAAAAGKLQLPFRQIDVWVTLLRPQDRVDSLETVLGDVIIRNEKAIRNPEKIR